MQQYSWLYSTIHPLCCEFDRQSDVIDKERTGKSVKDYKVQTIAD